MGGNPHVTPRWRVLMLVFNMVGKGTYWRAFHLARHLAQRGHQVTLMAMSRQHRLAFTTSEKEGVRLVEAPDMLWGILRSGWDVWESAARILWLHRQRFDLVHAFESRPTVLLPALYLKHVRHIPLIMDWGDWFGRGGAVEERPNALWRAVLRPVETFLEEGFRKHADGTLVICEALYRRAVSLGVSPETILKLRDGADVDSLRPLDMLASRRTLGLPNDVLLIGYLGAIFQRDAQLMAQAFDLIHTAQPRTRLLLIGYVNAPVEQMLKAPQVVIRTGELDYAQLSLYLSACDICWLPYCNSGANRGRWPLKLNDYMAAGRPIVATAVGDVAEVMQKYEIGFLTEDTANALASSVLALLADLELRARFGRNARQVAEQTFAWHLRVAELETFYAHVLQAYCTKELAP
jgi:glycosyltransferase involved in cell wall biosynthesis